MWAVLECVLYCYLTTGWSTGDKQPSTVRTLRTYDVPCMYRVGSMSVLPVCVRAQACRLGDAVAVCARAFARAIRGCGGVGGRGGCTKTLSIALESVDGRVTKLNMVEPGGLCKVRQVELEVRSSSVLL